MPLDLGNDRLRLANAAYRVMGAAMLVDPSF